MHSMATMNIGVPAQQRFLRSGFRARRNSQFDDPVPIGDIGCLLRLGAAEDESLFQADPLLSV
jgi:hypothetical protein